MAVYVDDYRAKFGRMTMCHMMADTLDELHLMARTLGLKEAWFQPASYPHYDLCTNKREKAVELGAQEITARDLVIKMAQIYPKKQKKMVLCLLANAWGGRLGRKMTIKWYKPNPINYSSRKMWKICGSGAHDMRFGNVCPVWFSNPKQKGDTDLEHTKSVLRGTRNQKWDAVIVCGVQARKAIEELQSQNAEELQGIKLLFMQHPASRTLTKIEMEKVSTELLEHLNK